MCRRPCAAIKSSVLTSWTYLTSFMKTDSKTTSVVGSCRIWVQAGREWFESCLRSRSVAARNNYTECRQSNHSNEYVKCFIWNKQSSGVQRARVFKSMFFLQGIETNVFHSGRQFPIFTLPILQRVYPPTFALSLIIVFYFIFQRYKKKLESNKIKWETHLSRIGKNST